MAENTYINLFATQSFYYTTKQLPKATRLSLSFEQWQNILKNDTRSIANTARTEWAKNGKPLVFVNATNED